MSKWTAERVREVLPYVHIQLGGDVFLATVRGRKCRVAAVQPIREALICVAVGYRPFYHLGRPVDHIPPVEVSWETVARCVESARPISA